MLCPDKSTYIIAQGDTLPKLAREHQTTIGSILALNPRLNPRKLPVGGTIEICSGDSLSAPRNTPPPTENIPESIVHLFAEHMQIGADLAAALSNADQQQADTLRRKWYTNAAQIADSLGRVSPLYNPRELRQTLHNYLNLILR